MPTGKKSPRETPREKPRATRPGDALKKAEAALRKTGMGFPEATEDFPWGHRALKIKGKAFVFMSREDNELSLSVKLPDSGDFALMQPYASPTGYGLGKSGWVTARFGEGRSPGASAGELAAGKLPGHRAQENRRPSPPFAGPEKKRLNPAPNR